MEKIIEAELRKLKSKEKTVETTLARVEAYKKAIEDPESFFGIVPGTTREFGIPKGSTVYGSSVEKAITDKEESIDMLKEWIKDDLSRIYPLQVELEQLKGALGALNKQQNYIIECKYFEGMFWRDIEYSFNEEFKNKAFVTHETLKKINKKSISEMAKILEVFYSRIFLG